MPNHRNTRSLGIVTALIAVVVFVADQASKTAIVNLLGQGGQPFYVDVVGSWLRFVLVTNTGAAFGLLQGRTLFFTIVAVLAVPVLIIFHNSLPSNGWLARSTVGLLIGGALGNLADRLRYGYVIDFIDVGIGDMRWPTFNIADSAFVVGVFVLAFYFLTSTERSVADTPSSERSNAGG